jgi:hypothetical protein
MLKLADPESGRRAIQIWDKDGGNLITTLLTIPNERMEAPDEPVVLFSEQPIGQAAAVKAWFYPGDRIGQEFIYPKDQAMRIAQAANTPVLAYNNDNAGADTAAMRGAAVGRVDGAGQVAADTTTDNTSTAATADNTAARAATAPNANTTDNTTSAATADNTAAQASTARPSTAQAPAATAPAAAAQANTAQANTTDNTTSAATADNTAVSSPAASTASANRSGAADRTAVSGQTGTTTPSPVGTSGQATAAPAAPAAAATAPRQEGTTASRQELPRTASPLTTIALLAGLSLLGSLSLRQLRKRRLADNRL